MANSMESVAEELNLSSEDEDDFVLPWEQLLRNITITQLDNLSKIFKNKIHFESKLSKEQFVIAVDTVMGSSKYSMQAISLYNEIPYRDNEKITWNQFLEFTTKHILPKQQFGIQLTEADILPFPHVKKEAIMKIVLLETESSFCYAIISKYGKVGLYTGNFELLAKYIVTFTRSDDYFNEKFRIRKSVWVTDAIFLTNVRMFVVCTSTRSMIIYDASGQKHTPLWLIEGMPNVAHCLTYHCDTQSKLFMGNDDGSVTILTFIQQYDGLLRKKYNDKLNTFYWRELHEETKYITIQTYKNLHNSLVISIEYFHENFTLVTCSRDVKNSVVFFNLKEKIKNYVFKISQGVSCYSISTKLHIMVSGTDSGLVQVWSMYVITKPVEVLTGHKVALIGVKILEYENVLISCSKDGVFKMWDLKDYECRQTILLNYPSFEVLGKLIEWGTTSIYSGPTRFTDNKNSAKDNIEETDIFSWKKKENSTTKQIKVIKNRKTYMILITCCNFIAKIDIKYDNCSKYDHLSALPPPPLQNTVIIPDTWNIGEHKIVAKSETTINKTIELDEFLQTMMTRNWMKNIPKNNLNYKIAQLEITKLKMRKPVALCAPYIALDLFEMEEVKLSTNLPIPDYKKTQQLADKTHRLLSAASTRSGLLSDRSSKSRSSRSSIIEF